jgi:phosphopantetheinyl transferase (holo-ACP synthase)
VIRRLLTTDAGADRVVLRTAFAELVCAPRERGAPFRTRIPLWEELTRLEREHCAAGLPRLDRYAGRVAAKQAVQNMLSRCGPVSLSDVAIATSTHGRPVVVLSPRARAVARFAGVDPEAIEISISHRSERAIAVASPDHVEVGIDLLDQNTVAGGVHKFGDRLVNRILHDHERPRACDIARAVADGIAAKEAAGKILKRGWPEVSWLDVTTEPAGRDVPDALGFFARELTLERGFGAPRFGRARCAGAAGSDPWLIWAERGSWLVALAVRPRIGFGGAA